MFHALNKRFTLAFPGLPYVLNSSAVIAVSKLLKVSLTKVQVGIKTFPGTARRLEIIKENKHYTLIDDYAHHPTAIHLTLFGLREKYPTQKIIVIFQPHMFSRTKALLKDFAKSFSSADVVGIMEVYPSARESSLPTGKQATRVGGKQLAGQAKFHHKNVTYLKTMLTARKFVKTYAKNGNVIILMGAGNIRDIVN